MLYLASVRAGSRIAKGEGHKCSSAAEVGVESIYRAHFRRGDCANKLSIYDNCILDYSTCTVLANIAADLIVNINKIYTL